MLTSGDLLEYQATLELSLQDLAEVVTTTSVPDDSGGFTLTTDTGDPVEARLSPQSGLAPGERSLIGSLLTENMLILTLPARTPIAAKDQVVVYHLDPDTGTVLDTRPVEVQLIMAPRTYEISRRVMVTELV